MSVINLLEGGRLKRRDFLLGSKRCSRLALQFSSRCAALMSSVNNVG